MAWKACLPIVVAAVLLLIFTLRGWSSRFGQRRDWVVRIGLRLTWEVALPVALLLGALLLASMLGETNWDEILLAWPDVGLWILVISAVLLLPACSESKMTWQITTRPIRSFEERT
jgi:hypothetical protein